MKVATLQVDSSEVWPTTGNTHSETAPPVARASPSPGKDGCLMLSGQMSEGGGYSQSD